MSSKLDYLSKYTSAAADDDDKRMNKKSKKGKKKKKQRKNESSRSISRAVATNLVDEDDFPVGRNDDLDDFGNEDDEDPVVVEGVAVEGDSGATQAMAIDRNPRGVWKAVGTAGGGKNATASGGQEKSHLQPVRNRQQRYDSSSSSEDDRARPRQQQRHDSSSDEESGRGNSNGNGNDSKPRRRERYDSSSSSDRRRGRRSGRRDGSSSTDEDHRTNGRSGLQKQPRKARYDSSSSDDEKIARSSSNRSRGRERDQNRSRSRKRYNSSSDSERGGGRRVRGNQRYDSEESDTGRGHPPKRQRHDSDEYNSEHSSDENDKTKKARMSSGHKAGLQNYQDFNRSERKVQARKHKDAQRMVDKHGMGETVYRDKEGKKTAPDGGTSDDGNGISKQQAEAEAAKRLNQGKVQREARETQARELVALQDSGFARYKEDDRLEEELRNEIRKDDPMAKYALSKQQSRRRNTTRTSGSKGAPSGPPPKPVYKGPPPGPNRFGIRPGYRWDGVDRGNAFEDKVLAKKFSKAQNAERAYKYSTSDM